ncbi:MAG: DUF4440 domain-containing protein [Pseudomonadota bacterium]
MGAQWSKHYRQGNLDALMALYTDDAFVALHGQPALEGRAAIRRYFNERLGQADTTFELVYEQIEFHGDVAHIISRYWLRAVNRRTGAVVTDAGRSLLIYRWQAGQWRIAVDIDQATPDVRWPSPAGLTEPASSSVDRLETNRH